MAEQRAPKAVGPSRSSRQIDFSADTMAALGRTIRYALKFYKWHFLIVVVCILVSALATIQATLFQQRLIDDFIVPAVEGTGDLSGLAPALASLAIILAVGVAASYTSNRIMVNVGQGTQCRLRNEIFDHMETLPLRYFDSHQHGDIMSIYTNDIDTLRQVVAQSLPQLVNSAVTIVTTFTSMVILSIPLTCMSLALVAVMLFITTKLIKISSAYFVEQQSSLASVNGYIEEMMGGQKVVKVFCHENQNIDGFHKLNHELRDASISANTTSNILMPINANLGNISYVLCAALGSMLALTGNWGITLGTIVSFLTLNRNFTQPITQVSMQLANVTMAAAGSKRIFALIDEESETDEGYVQLVNACEDEKGELKECSERSHLWAWRHPHHDGTLTYTRLEGAITLDDVDFGYDPDKLVLHGITLDAEPGQKVAFVGATGAGKTTITNLINRFYDVADGKIRFDGINVNKIKKGDLRRSLGVVLQDPHLFTGTVMENIRYGRLDATDQECIDAAKLVSADTFIRRLPDGYQTMITGDGANLSQGQRQLLTIARAAVADPPALILDEATSSIDTHTEQLVQQGMDALMGGRTTFVIAHRLSTVRNADCIMVMELGRIIERGTHDELIAKKGRYYQLYTGNQIGE